jgi:hypothetical protein
MSESKYVSLQKLLTDWYETTLEELPKELRSRVEKDFAPARWDQATPNGRRMLASQADYQNDPANASTRSYWESFYEELWDIRNKISQWESVAVPTALDLEVQERNLVKLRTQLDKMVKEESIHLSGSQKEQARAERARNAAHAKHNQPGGYNEKRQKVYDAWFSGCYPNKNQCAIDVAQTLNLSVKTVRNHLYGLPKLPGS